MSQVISLKNIQLSYEKQPVLRKVSMSIEEGECVALLGPNGVGKSSLIDIITNAIQANAGEVKVWGQNYNAVKGQIGVLFDTPPLFPLLKVDEIIKYFCTIYGVSYPQKIVDDLEVPSFKDKLFGVLSKGQKKKAGIVLTTMHNPKLLILDEPTAELDPFIRTQTWKVFKDSNRTILFTTHIWEEALKYADKVAFMHGGEIVGYDTPENLLSSQFIPAERKIVIAKKKKLAPLIDKYLYFEEENNYHIFPDDVQEFFDNLTYIPSNYSIMDKELQDVYSYLITDKKKLVNESI